MITEYQKTTTSQLLDNQEQDKFPLSCYGCELLKYMKHNVPDRFWNLTYNGELMKNIHTRELELINFKNQLMKELEKKFPRPKTDSFIQISSHMNLIAEQAEAIVRLELFKAI